MMDERFRSARLVGALNLSPKPGDVAGNLLMAEREIRTAKMVYTDLRWLVLPELFTCGYADLASVHRHAERAEDGPSARFFASLAGELGLYVVYGFPERVPGGVRDSASLVGPDGVLLTYGKKHLVRETGEDLCFVPGDGPLVVDVDGLRVALAICWDLCFPEFVREAAYGGVELVLSPAGWRERFGPQYALACAARALDNGVYVAGANQIGAYPEARFGGGGGVYGPDGLCVSRHVPGSALEVAELDATFPASWRARFGDTLIAPKVERLAPSLEPPLEPVA
jgi:predicted amidohydrolase